MSIFLITNIDRVEIIHTPAHAYWLNMAEIKSSVFTRQELDRSFTDNKQVEIFASLKSVSENIKTLNSYFLDCIRKKKNAKNISWNILFN